MSKKSSIVDKIALKNKIKTKRPGIHSKKKTSTLKSSKNYKKLYVGQG